MGKDRREPIDAQVPERFERRPRTVNDRLMASLLSRLKEQRRREDELARESARLYARTMDEVLGAIASISRRRARGGRNLSWMRAEDRADMTDAIAGVLANARRRELALWERSLGAAAEAEFAAQGDALRETLPDGVPVPRVSLTGADVETIVSAAPDGVNDKSLADWRTVSRTRGTETLAALAGEVSRAVERGASVDDLGLRVTEVMREASARAERVARTEMTKAHDLAGLAYGIKLSKPFTSGGRRVKGLAHGVRYTAILDERTSDICSSRDGLVFWFEGREPSFDERPSIPAHHRCRSRYAVILRAADDLGLRGLDGAAKSMDGEPPSATDFAEWFQSVGEESQRRFLGPEKFRSWAAGRLNLSEGART